MALDKRGVNPLLLQQGKEVKWKLRLLSLQGVWGKRPRDCLTVLVPIKIAGHLQNRLKTEAGDSSVPLSIQDPRHLASSFLAFHLHVPAL